MTFSWLVTLTYEHIPNDDSLGIETCWIYKK